MLPDRVLMRKISGGHALPWPEPLADQGFVFPKDYRLHAFPRTATGQPWYDIPDEDYFSWLADYLPASLPPLSASQQRLMRQLDSYKRFSGFWIGDRAGWYESEAAMRPFHNFPDGFDRTGDLTAVKAADGGYTYQEYVAWIEGVFDPGDRIMTPEEYILDDYGWSLVLMEEQRQFSAYWPDFLKFDGFNLVFYLSSHQNEPPDAGWRVYLGMALQRIPDKASRIKEIEDFYYAWHDMIK